MAGPHLQAALHESRERLFTLIRDLSEEQFRHAASDSDGWTIAAHLAHLLRIERIYAERAEQARVHDGVRIESTRVHNDDDPGLAQKLAVPQIIHGMQAARRDLISTLEGCDGGALERAVEHETIGRITIEQMAAKMASHEDEHADTIASLVRGLPPRPRVTIPLTPRA